MRIKHSFIFVFFFLPLALLAQSWPGWTPESLAKCNTAIDNEHLTDQEKQVVMIMNMARNNGKLFASSVLKSYLDTTSRIYSKDFVSSLRDDLKRVKDLPALVSDVDLFNEAVVHAADMGMSGKTGHNTSSGKKPSERFKNLEKTFNPLAENCHYGSDDPITIVIELLIDNKIAGTGHRKNILSPAMAQVGVAIKPHTKYRFNAVMDFGTRVKN